VVAHLRRIVQQTNVPVFCTADAPQPAFDV